MQEIKDKSPATNIPSVSFLTLIGFFFGELLTLMRFMIAFIVRNKYLLLIFTVIGLGIGSFMFKVTPSTYKLSMIVKPTELEGTVFGQMLNSLNDLAVTGSSDELARNLKISVDEARMIVKISAQNLQGLALAEDTAKAHEGRPFIIDVFVRENTVATILQSSLINYFNNNSYLNKLKTDKQQLLNEKLVFIKSELQKLDSLKTQYNNFMASSKTPTMYYNNVMDPVKIYEASSIYFDEKNTIEEWMRQSKDVILKIDSVKPSINSYSGTLYQYSLLYGLVFFLLGCLVALLKSKIS